MNVFDGFENDISLLCVNLFKNNFALDRKLVVWKQPPKMFPTYATVFNKSWI